MADSIQNIDKKCIFRETFNSEADVRRNGGIPTAVTFSNGKATFDGATSVITGTKFLNGTYSIRIKCTPTSRATHQTLSYFSDISNIYLSQTSGNLTSNGGGTYYVNGVQTVSTTLNTTNDLVVTGITINRGSIATIGRWISAVFFFTGSIDLFEIYQGTLTADEVWNMSGQ